MSNFSNSIVETLLENVTDYIRVELSDEQLTKLKGICSRWRDEESIEIEINTFLQKNGYKLDENCVWVEI